MMRLTVILASFAASAFAQAVPVRVILLKPALATEQVKAPFGDASLWLEPGLWKETGRDGGRISLTNASGVVKGLVVSDDTGGVPTPTMRGAVLADVSRISADAKVIEERRQAVNRRDLLYLKIEGTSEGVPMRFEAYAHGGTKSNVFTLVWIPVSESISQMEDVSGFLAGIEVREESAPAPQELRFGAFNIRYDWNTWNVRPRSRDGNWELEKLTGTALASVYLDRTPVPLETLLRITLDRTLEVDPNARVVSEEDRTIPGGKVRIRRLDATSMGLKLSYLSCYYAGRVGTAQIITWTFQDQLGAERPALEDLLTGLAVEDPNDLL